MSKESKNDKSRIELTADDLKRIVNSSQYDAMDDEIDLGALWSGLIKRKWLIFITTIFTTVLAIAASLQITPMYESTVKLVPVSTEGGASSLMAKYGDLASLAGIALPSSGGVSVSKEAVEVLLSKRFLADFIQEKQLKKILFYHQWDEKNQKWIKSEPSIIDRVKDMLLNSSGKSKVDMQNLYNKTLQPGEPTIYSAVNFFTSNVISVNEYPKSGFYSLRISWVNPVQARDWANELVKRVDDELRQEAMEEAEANIQFMNQKLAEIELHDIRTIALKSIEENMKKVAFAQAQKDYVFKVIDPAIAAEKPYSPRRTMMAVLGFLFGLVISVMIALILNWRQNHS
jgi:capsular polysaccharide biosynthesis protein